jgi:hypothetical protein
MFQAWLLATIIGQIFYKWKYVYMHGFERHKPTFYTLNPMVCYVFETTRKQARFETTKFIKKMQLYWNDKEIKCVEGVSHYNHKTITCSKLTPNFKIFNHSKNW